MAKSPEEPPLTMAQIAAVAGVSVATVSKVINQRTDVAPTTRERVERVMAERGYMLNKAARSLRKGNSGQIDFLVGQELNSYYAFEILRGVEEALLPTEVRMVLASTHALREREQQWRQRLSEGAIDGAVLVLADKRSLYLQELTRRGIPFVVVDPFGELGPEDLSVSATNWSGGKLATAYLLSLGHRRIAALMGLPDHPCTQDRIAGYRHALQEAGVPVDPALIHFANFHAEQAYQEMMQILALPEMPTAIFVGSDEQCLGVYRALFERGIAVPGAMSVIGFDNMPYAEWVTPALTTIHQPLLEMGRVATKLLLRLIAGEPVESVRIELATPLIKRASCAPPQGNLISNPASLP
ncbi:LacI family DNA-binding transcriptional regulator [Ktedonobacter robiniae]|uniref:LacI family transcriptional regulator n=1 Tax=Ktedonobacter robiniae TaxID=2778365 RepID=A0ABQ3UVZ6_9CHLR|nr:LacI family DNA-binding transcriptional regulator [Ktedonobacter robiniae]GHO56857.1 LacI family transcriptional regulator [Ktedonobacter robiniae]